MISLQNRTMERILYSITLGSVKYKKEIKIPKQKTIFDKKLITNMIKSLWMHHMDIRTLVLIYEASNNIIK